MRIREAVRALIIDPGPKVLLVAFDFPDGVVWAMPGGGVQEGETPAIGPVRSARFYLVQWASEVQAAFAHYGGDRRTLQYLKATPLAATSVDGITRGNKAFKRVKTKRAPHNAYTSTERLRDMALKLGAPQVSV